MSINVDYGLVASWIPEGTKVLDVGCGDGALLKYLEDKRRVQARGLEISGEGVRKAMARGLAVIQGDADTDLAYYADKSFDYVILSHTLQAMPRPRETLEQLTRIGRKTIVAIPNFAHYTARLYLLMRGKMPVTKALPYTWYDTPNIHFCTIKDFLELCAGMNLRAERGYALNSTGRVLPFPPEGHIANLLAREAIFLLS